MLALLLLVATANAQFLGGGGGDDGGDFVGGQEGQCCGSCGYLLCESTGECYRPFSETCEVEVNEHGCPNDCSQYMKDFDVIDCTDGSVLRTESWSSSGYCVVTKFSETFDPTIEPTEGLGGTGLVGGYDEETGCCGSCGYVQCKSTGECYRPWMVSEDYCPEEEEQTPTEEPTRPMLGGIDEETGCCPGCGEILCESTGECYRPWLGGCDDEDTPSEEPSEEPLVGGNDKETGCCGSCGEVLCESSGECYRPWEGGCEFEVNEYGCPTGCNRYMLEFNVIDCSNGNVLSTESWSSIGHCVDDLKDTPTEEPTQRKTRGGKIRTADFCAGLEKDECKNKAVKGFCKFHKKNGCNQAKNAPDVMMMPKDMYNDYSATCSVLTDKLDCRNAGCHYDNHNGGDKPKDRSCAPYTRGEVNCKNVKDMELCAKYGCRSRSNKKGEKCLGNTLMNFE